MRCWVNCTGPANGAVVEKVGEYNFTIVAYRRGTITAYFVALNALHSFSWAGRETLAISKTKTALVGRPHKIGSTEIVLSAIVFSMPFCVQVIV